MLLFVRYSVTLLPLFLVGIVWLSVGGVCCLTCSVELHIPGYTMVPRCLSAETEIPDKT